MVLICNLIEREKQQQLNTKQKRSKKKKQKHCISVPAKTLSPQWLKFMAFHNYSNEQWIQVLFSWHNDFFHSPVCSLITYNSLGLNWLKIANTHKNESFHYCKYLGGCVFSLPHKIVWDYIMQDGKWKIFLQRKWAKRKGFKSFPMYLKFNRTFLCTEYFANTIFIFYSFVFFQQK